MIQYDKEAGIISINTVSITYAIGILNDVPICLYWGGRIHAQDLQGYPKSTYHSSFNQNMMLERAEYPVWDTYTFTNSCFQLTEPIFPKLTKIDVQNNNLVITMTDDQTEHVIELHYHIDFLHDVIIKSVKFICGNKKTQINKFLSASVSLPTMHENYVMHYRAGAWANEFNNRSQEVTEGLFKIESTRGLSGPHFNPAIALSGENDVAYAAMLGWSGSWQMSSEKTIFGNVIISAGWNDVDFTANLLPGEELISPPLYLCFTDKGLGSLSRKLHDYQRDVLSTDSRKRRVLYNSWEATYFDVHVDDQLRLADRAAQMGVELFVVDDGWFGQRKNDTAGLGDWYVNTEKFPLGLQQLIGHVKSKDMAFGLWVEPESVNPDSDLYRAHPDWAYSLDGHQPMMLRNQYLLNLGRKDVEVYVKDMLFNLLKQYDISYLKWDMNRPFTDISETYNPMARELHVQAVYRILRELREAFTEVDIEACSGGGARVDLGMIKLTDQFWPSDNTNPTHRLSIQDGCATFYPPRMISCWVTDSNSGAYGNTLHELQYRFLVSMSGGTLGIGANISQYSNEQMRLASEMIETYKKIRHLIFDGDRYSVGNPSKDDLHQVQYVSKDQLETVVFFFRSSNRGPSIETRVRLNGLNENYLYVTSGMEHASLHGSSLMKLGIGLSMPESQLSNMMHFKAVLT